MIRILGIEYAFHQDRNLGERTQPLNVFPLQCRIGDRTVNAVLSRLGYFQPSQIRAVHPGWKSEPHSLLPIAHAPDRAVHSHAQRATTCCFSSLYQVASEAMVSLDAKLKPQRSRGHPSDIFDA